VSGEPTSELSADGDTLTVTLRGEVDLLVVSRLRDAFESALAGARTVVFDLTGVSFIDSSGLGLIATPLSVDREVIVRNPAPRIRMIIASVGFAEVVEFDPAEAP
jgi:anti-sigma B factor antagonist